MNFETLNALPSNTPRSTTSRSVTQRFTEWTAQRMDDMQQGLEMLRAMPTPEERDKKAAIEKAERLKSQLNMLKMMMAAASPSEAKALAAQLRSIARQLAGLAPALRNTQTDTSSTNNTVESVNAAVNNAQPPSSEETPIIQTENEDVKVDLSLAAHSVLNPQNNTHTTSLDDDVRKVLKEAANALKSALALFKQKFLQHHDSIKEAEKDLADLEDKLNDIGHLSTDTISPVTPEISGSIGMNNLGLHLNISV
jgi:chromosome segregation ATPase